MQGKFYLTVLDIDTIIYKNEVSSVFVPGDRGEFELLSCHYPILSLLRQGDIIINWEEVISINRGILKFLRNDCVIIIEIAS
jgi:F0F1-type ATP synthase epsilon subunit